MNQLHEMKMKTKILIIDDEAAIRQILAESLKDEGFDVLAAPDGPVGLQVLSDFKPHICFLDIWMPKMDGLEVLTKAVPLFPETSFVMISGHGTIETAVKATKIGAWDFVEKPLSLDKVGLVIEHVLKFRSEKEEKQALLNKLRQSIALVGESKSLQTVREKITTMAKNAAPVLVCGEVGSGRQLISQNIHYMSTRASKALSEINCGTLPQDLIEIELFGIEKGSLPGIDKTRKGKLELIDGGTLVIEEIEEMPLILQEKLVSFIKNQTIKRLGSSEEIKTNVRIILTSIQAFEILTTNPKISKELLDLIKSQLISVEPLRSRTEDILPLIIHFSDIAAKQMAAFRKTISEQGVKLLLKHSWPGNIRELKNFIERVYILTPSDYVDVHDLRFAGLVDKKETATSGPEAHLEMSTFREARAEFEKDYLVKKIQENGGNISKTAETIGLERSYLHRKIKAYGIESDN
jgi:two-component system, NtrC family, nitrogen regulation response regulator NtrX